ncbi:MAG: hypothetical protein QOJ26_808 [Thermoplasmata archaeon]|nr:hypothetical protein [Thermoplasmata archaeon]
MRVLFAAGLFLSLALAGCSIDTHRPKGDDGGDGGATTTSPDGSSGGTEEDSGVLDIVFESNAPATIEVPFPTLDSCRSPEAWMEGEPSLQNAVPELLQVDGERNGRVLSLESQEPGRAEFSVQIPLGPACQTFRYDPWTIDPDRDDGAAEVRVTQGELSSLTVLVRRVRDGTGEAVLYEGHPTGSGWTALEGRTVSV